ncbi:MAG TPA: NAD(P)H-hydrate dehydratase, partial [Rhodocyclaceae bacterium]|nr:NAD(P)H-hydrate dehydratase [Rhodocyclaceae bacterium]
ALKLGAGRVYLGFPGEPPLPVDPGQPELMLRDADDFFAAPLTALACGPGLGQSAAARALLTRAIAARLPLVLDADALNLLGSDAALAEAVRQRSAPTILTPHPGEAARLLASGIDAVQSDRLAAASRLATHYQAWIVLKGCGSIVVSPDGNWWINSSGNAGLASAGSGDVLSGFLAALLAAGSSTADAVLAATWLHGAAADALVGADPATGPIGLTASELPNAARSLLNQLIAQTATTA